MTHMEADDEKGSPPTAVLGLDRDARPVANLEAFGVVGYLSDFEATSGDGRLQDQKASIDAHFERSKTAAFRYVIDIGWPRKDAKCPPALFAIVRAARVRAIDIVVVGSVSRLARDPDVAARIASILCDAGVDLREAGRSRDPAWMSPRDSAKEPVNIGQAFIRPMKDWREPRGR